MLSHQLKSHNPKNIQTLNPSDAGSVALIHARSLPNDFLPSLGIPVLTVIYKHLLAQKETSAFGYAVEKTMFGFIVGSTNRHGFIKQVMISSWLELLPLLVMQLLGKPQILFSLIQTLFYGQEDTQTTNNELIVLCVDDAKRGKGIGTVLLNTLRMSLRGSQDKEMIINAYAGNSKANRFYIKHKASLTNTFSLYGKKWNSYKMPL